MGITISNTGDLALTNNAANVEVLDANGLPLDRKTGTTLTSNPLTGINLLAKTDNSSDSVALGRFGRNALPYRRLLFWDPINTTTLNAQRWVVTTNIMNYATGGGATGWITLNNTVDVTSGAFVVLSSKQSFVCPPSGGLHFSFRAQGRPTSANQQMVVGFSDSQTNPMASANAIGWAFTTTGMVPYVLMTTNQFTGADFALVSGFNSSEFYDYHITISDGVVVFHVYRTSTGVLLYESAYRFPDTRAVLLPITHYYLNAYVNNSGTATARALVLTDVCVQQTRADHNLSFDQMLAENKYAIPHAPSDGAQVQTFANSSTAASATLSNTVPSYTSLGGLFTVGLVAGSNTDYALYGYTVPSPYKLKIKAVRISAGIAGANEATPILLAWALGINGTTANLSTAGHITKSLGNISLAASAPNGSAFKSLEVTFDTPLVCHPGTTAFIILRYVNGTVASGGQNILGMVDVQGVFE